MTHLSKTAAIKEARPMVGIAGRHTSWHITGPYDCANTDGPNTSRQRDSYDGAARCRAAWVAEIALNLMGLPMRDSDSFRVRIEEGGSINEIVNHYISELRQ